MANVAAPRFAASTTVLTDQSQEVLIGHIDSGVDIDQPAFSGAIAAYRYFDRTGRYDPAVEIHDASGHGTATASVIVGKATDDWAGGIAPQSKLAVATAIESGHRIARILSALIWMLEEPVNIVNLSVGIVGWNPIFRPVIQQLRQKGVLVVAAIGNGGAGTYHSPGVYPEVLSVGACNEEGRAISSSGSKNEFLQCHKPDILALSSLTSIRKGGGLYQGDLGTSGATAYVSGVAAQIMSLHPEATACQVEHALKATALPPNANQKHRSRAGRIQPQAAAACLTSLPTLPSREYIQPIDVFRDADLQHSMKYLPPNQTVPAILYGRPTEQFDTIITTAIGEGAIRFHHLYPKHNFALVAVTKKQLESWWDDERILMISRVD